MVSPEWVVENVGSLIVPTPGATTKANGTVSAMGTVPLVNTEFVGGG
jgi:hypothetical protein